MGWFQTQVLFAAGLCFAADAMEVLLLSFLSIILRVEWGLTERQMDTIISIVFAGAMVGTLILGPLADKVGRRPVFSVTAGIIAIFGLLTALVSNYEWLLITRFMVGFGVGGLTIPFDTLAEFVPTSHRGTNLLAIEFFWSAGTLLVPLFAWWTLSAREEASWRYFVVLCAIPCIVSTAMGLILVPESPRWLLTQGRHDEALETLRLAARRNGKDPYAVFPEGTLLWEEHVHKAESFGDLFSEKWRRITFLLWGAWFGLAFLYYGAIMLVSLVFSSIIDDDDQENAANGGAYDFDYSAIFIAGSAEIFGLLAVIGTIDKWGRIPSQIVTYLTGGVTCLLLGALARDSSSSSRNVLIVVAFLARMAMMGASCTTWVSTSELLPTDIRSTGHSAANAVARIGAFSAPYIISTGTPLTMIGSIMFVVSAITALIAGYLPETAGKALGEAHVVHEASRKEDDPTLPVETVYQQVL